MVPHVYLIITVLLATHVVADFDCVCNYVVEKQVLQSPQITANVLGYMYEFDCKPRAQNHGHEVSFYAIQFEKMLGYVQSGNTVQAQVCPGDPVTADLIPVTTQHNHVVTTEPATAVASTTTTIKTYPTTIKKATITTTERYASTYPSTTQAALKTTEPAAAVASTTTTIKTYPTTIKKATVTTAERYTSTYPSTTQAHKTTKLTTETPTITAIHIRPRTTTPTTATPTTTSMSSKTTISTAQTYIGVGYNLLEGNPNRGDSFESGVTNGALITRRIFQLLLPGNDTAAEVEYRDHPTCVPSLHFAIVYNGQTYQNELLQYVVPENSHPMELVTNAFAFSKEMTDVRQVTEYLGNQSGTLYKYISSTCTLGTLRYKEELTGTGNINITQEFAADVCNLTQSTVTMDMMPYFLFLDKWGTSIVTEVDMGTRTIRRYEMSTMQLFQQVEEMDSYLIQHAGYYNGFSSSLIINSTMYPSSKAAQETVGSLHETIHDGSHSVSTPIKMTVVPITAAFDFKYWKHIRNQLVVEGVCLDNLDANSLQKAAEEITKALTQYAVYKSAVSSVQHYDPIKEYQLQIPVTWPVGTYGLMEAASGCPASQVSWLQGWRKQDTEDSNPSNEYTPGIEHYLAGKFNHNNIETRFCMKVTASTTKFDQIWPKGTYCLLKFGECPNGFESGYVKWDDEDISNNNDKSGTLPDGNYDKDTKIYYCCRSDGSPATSINLPTDRPFLLVRNYGGMCQSVHGMNVHEVSIKWDDEDVLNKDTDDGSHPLDEGGNDDHLLHFCHYESNCIGGGPAVVG